MKGKLLTLALIHIILIEFIALKYTKNGRVAAMYNTPQFLPLKTAAPLGFHSTPLRINHLPATLIVQGNTLGRSRLFFHQSRSQSHIECLSADHKAHYR
jgi:hypothetical protein